VVVKDEREDGSKKEDKTGEEKEKGGDIAWKYEGTFVILDDTTAGVFGRSNGVDGDNDDVGGGSAGGDDVETTATVLSD